MTDELSPKELTEVTKKTRAASQAAVLAKLGVPFVFLGRAVKVSRAIAAAHALVPEKPSRHGGIDFSQVR